MQAYLYIDFNQDGQFDAVLDANGQPTPSSELIAYNYFNGRNSDGKEITADPADVAINTMPAFRIPEMLPTGNYRARLKSTSITSTQQASGLKAAKTTSMTTVAT